MQLIIFFFALALSNVYCYHDPDLNYHLSQVQKVADCNNGYSYPAPAVQLATTGVQIAQQQGYASSGYSAGVAYQAPKITYAAQPANYQTSSQQSNYAAPTFTKEVHGYATSAGLSAVASTPRPITPITTYAQAPIIAKVTGTPLIAKFTQTPAKTTFIAQQSLTTGSLAKASLNSYNVQTGGPVVSQVYAAPAARYTTAPDVKVQSQAQYFTPGIQYSQAANVKEVSQYSTSSVSQVSAPSTGYFAPNVQYTAPAIQYAAPASQYSGVQYASKGAVTQYNAPPATQYRAAVQYKAPVVAQYAAPAVAQYSTASVAQYTAPAVTQYSAPAVTQYAAPAVTQYAAPAPQYAAPTVIQHSAPAAQYNVQHTAQYTAPAVTQYSAPAVTQYATPAVTQYSAPAAVTHYSAPTVTQYSAPAPVAQYATPAVTQYSASAVTQYASSAANHASATSSQVASTLAKIVASAGVKNVHTDFLENYDHNPKYAYEYSVNDPHTGDVKHQKEERNGEVVKGQYSLVEPDGSVRTVNYVADWETGFHADVSNSKDKH